VVVSGWALNSTVPDDSMVLKAGGNSYTGGRWGDYFSVDLDPNDKRTTWVIGEYAGGGNWGTWIGEVRYPRLEGDVNRDGCVNDVDLAALIFAFGQSGVGLLEDLNGDNVVDDSDLSLVVSNFGDGC
jgi:hypothetical protein